MKVEDEVKSKEVVAVPEVKENKPSKASKTTQTSAEKKVVIRYGGVSGWSLRYKGREPKMLGPGDRETFDLTDKEELRAFIEIIKQINTREGNTCSYIDKKDLAEPTKYRYRFTIVEGEENIPEEIRKLTFTNNNRVTNEQREAIEKLVPDYFTPPPKVLYELKNR